MVLVPNPGLFPPGSWRARGEGVLFFQHALGSPDPLSSEQEHTGQTQEVLSQKPGVELTVAVSTLRLEVVGSIPVRVVPKTLKMVPIV